MHVKSVWLEEGQEVGSYTIEASGYYYRWLGQLFGPFATPEDADQAATA